MKSFFGKFRAAGVVVAVFAGVMAIMALSTPGAEATTTGASGTVTASIVAGHFATPLTASGYNKDVYILVNGTKLHVNYVYTDAYVPDYLASTRAQYYSQGVVVISSNLLLGVPPGSYVLSQWNANRNFNNGTQLCVGWTGGIPGHPCETVHS